MTGQSGSTETRERKPKEAPSIGQENLAAAPNGDGGGKVPESLSRQESSAPAPGGDRNRLTKTLQSIKRAPVWAWTIAAVVLVAVSLAILAIAGVIGGESAVGDGGNADNTANPPAVQKPVEGSFVGKVRGTNALISVVIAPAASDEERRELQLYVADGRRESHSFSGSISDSSFVAKPDDGELEAEGEVRGESVLGTVALGAGESNRFRTSRPAGAAGLYELTLTAGGKLRGMSAAGLGAAGRITLDEGTGVLRLADGTRLKLEVAEAPVGDLNGLRAGQVRLIALPSGEVAGAGKSRSGSEDDSSAFFIRSGP